MFIQNDLSYVKQEFIDRGFARLVPYAIRLDRYFTDEQKESNRAYAEEVGINSKEWKEHCEFVRQRVAEDNIKALRAICTEYNLGQFIPEDRKSFQFWFWCNDLANTVRDGRTGRDYSYVTLSMDDKLCYYCSETKEEIFANCKKILGDLPTSSNQAIFQYSSEYDTDAIRKAAIDVFHEIQNKWIKLFCIEGKLYCRQTGAGLSYYIKRKYSKGNNGQYNVSDVDLVMYGIDNGLI